MQILFRDFVCLSELVQRFFVGSSRNPRLKSDCALQTYWELKTQIPIAVPIGVL